MEVELCVDPSTLVSLVGGLHAQVLGVPGVLRDPAQQPGVALIPAGNLQGDHVVPTEEDHPHLGSLSGHGQRGPDPNQSEPSTKVRVVLQAVQKIRQRHDSDFCGLPEKSKLFIVIMREEGKKS